MKVVFDKIASATRNARITRESLLTDRIESREGMVIAVRVKGSKPVYNTVEDVHGRMIGLNDGDILAGVLGSRRALRGYAGVVPDRLSPGDTLEILNLGGVLGRCTSANLDLGPPLKAEVLGAVLSFPFLAERRGVLATIKDNAVPWAASLSKSAPVIYISGTCMSAGKTFAAGEIIRYLTRKGLRVAGGKLTGVSLLRDTLIMGDRGAVKSLSFSDAGVVSTSGAVSVPVSKGILNALNREEPDCLVIELGDGIMGEYGVQAILDDRELMAASALHVLCATDPVAAWGAAELYRERFKRRIGVISGPATDNAVGRSFIEEKLSLPAVNARLEPDKLGSMVETAVLEAGGDSAAEEPSSGAGRMILEAA